MRTRLLVSGISVVVIGLLAGCSSTDASVHTAAAASTVPEAEAPSAAPALADASGEASAAALGSSVIFTSDARFRANQLVSGRPSVVGFLSPWCGRACNTLWAQLEEVAPAYGATAHFLVMDVFDNPDAKTRYGISTVPALVCFKNGAPFKLRTGSFASASEVNEWLTSKCGIQPEASVSSSAAASPVREAAVAGPIPYVTDEEFRSNQLVSGRPSIVAFTAPWCGGTCDTLKYQLEVNSTFYGSAANFLFIDVESNMNRSVMQRYGIRSLPTLMCFKDDQILARRGVFPSVAEAEKWITDVCRV